MKKVNFVTSLSPDQQYEIHRWWITSCCIILGTIVIISYFLIPQICTLYTIKKDIDVLCKQTTHYTDLINKKNKLKEASKEIQKKTSLVNTYTNAPQSPFPYIDAITKACGKNIKIEQIRHSQQDLELIIICQTPEHTTQAIQHLAATNLFTSSKLTSLQNDAQSKQFKCIIKNKTT